jgi:hypothetical protein
MKRRCHMSQQNAETSNEKQGRVNVNNLPQQEEELTGDEARDIRGGAGVAGGVLRSNKGEEIPQQKP